MFVSFSEDLDDLSLRLRAEAPPTTPKASILRVEVGSGTDALSTALVGRKNSVPGAKPAQLRTPLRVPEPL